MSKEKGPLGRFADFLKRAFGGEDRKKSGSEVYSKFRHFFENMNRGDPLYPSVFQVSSLCDDALRIAKHRIRLSSRIGELDGKMTELENFNNLTDKEIDDLKKMLERFLSLTRERTQLLNQLTNFDKSLTEMFSLEGDALIAVPQIKDAEKHQRALRQDIAYLRGEKEELNGERSDMAKTLAFIKKFTVAMVAVFAAAAVLLVVMYLTAGWDIFLPTSILSMLVMAIVALLFYFRRMVRKEVRKNLRKQHRAIDLLNKKNVVLAYYSDYLRFSYKKYKVQNSKMLETNLKDFGNYKFLANRIDTCRRLMYETEDMIERFIREKKLTGVRATIEGFAKTVNLEDKKRYYNELATQKSALEKELSDLERRHGEIWETLMVINERDRSHGNMIETIIAAYLTEAGKLFDSTDELKKNDPIAKKAGGNDNAGQTIETTAAADIKGEPIEMEAVLS